MRYLSDGYDINALLQQMLGISVQANSWPLQPDVCIVLQCDTIARFTPGKDAPPRRLQNGGWRRRPIAKRQTFVWSFGDSSHFKNSQASASLD
jgi:hypothetical protein